MLKIKVTKVKELLNQTELLVRLLHPPHTTQEEWGHRPEGIINNTDEERSSSPSGLLIQIR